MLGRRPLAMSVGLPDITDWQHASRSISSLGMYDGISVTPKVGSDPERLGAMLAGPGFGEMLQMRHRPPYA